MIVDHIDKGKSFRIESEMRDPFLEIVMLIFNLFDE